MIKSFPRAQYTHTIIFENYSKSLIQMQISTIKNPNFEKPSRNLSNQSEDFSKKIWFRVGSVTAKCSNIEILAKIEGKEAKLFSKIYEGHIRI